MSPLIRTAAACLLAAGTVFAGEPGSVTVAALRPDLALDPCPASLRGRDGWTRLPDGGPILYGNPDTYATLTLAGKRLEFVAGTKAADLGLCSGKWENSGDAKPPPAREYYWGYPVGSWEFVPCPDPRQSFDVFAKGELRRKGRTLLRLSTRGAPSPRMMYALAAAGDRIIVWGGWGPVKGGANAPFGDGAVCDARNGKWRPITARGAPSPRFFPVTAWTGKKLVVWGGNGAARPGDGVAMRNDGALYDPARDAWTPMSAGGAPPARYKPVTVWTGKVMLVAGGGLDLTPGGASGIDDAWTYDPATDRWAAVANPPKFPEASWVKVFMDPRGRVILVNTMGFDVHVFDPAASAFVPTGMPEVLRGRTRALFVWTGARLFAWGGWTIPPGYENPCRGATRPCDPPSPPWAAHSDGWEFIPR